MSEIAWEHLEPMEIWRLLHFHPEFWDEYEETRYKEIEKKLLENQEYLS